MARSMPQAKFAYYELEFDSVIRGHHASKETWTPMPEEEILACQPDTSHQAQQKDDYAIGVWKNNEVVGHVPGGAMSKLLHQFLLSHKEARLTAVPTHNRAYEVGLVVPCVYKATLPRSAKLGKENMEILKQKLMEIDIADEEYVTIAVSDIINKMY